VMDPRVQAAVGLEINQDYTQCSVYELPGKLAVPTANRPEGPSKERPTCR
jgi:hypothetical protein